MVNRNSASRQGKRCQSPLRTWSSRPTGPGGKGHLDQRLAPPIFLPGGVSVQGCEGACPVRLRPSALSPEIQATEGHAGWPLGQQAGRGSGRQAAGRGLGGTEPHCPVRAQHDLSPAPNDVAGPRTAQCKALPTCEGETFLLIKK